MMDLADANDEDQPHMYAHWGVFSSPSGWFAPHPFSSAWPSRGERILAKYLWEWGEAHQTEAQRKAANHDDLVDSLVEDAMMDDLADVNDEDQSHFYRNWRASSLLGRQIIQPQSLCFSSSRESAEVPSTRF
jgi:hypothetical protein